MQIEKINDNQLEVTLNIEDLNKKNISLHSFMCNSLESQSLFIDILNFAYKEIGFNLKNHEVIIEAFSLPTKSSFVLVITRIPKTTYLHTSKTCSNIYKFSKTFWIKFNTLEEFCMFCNFINNNSNIKASLYLLDNCYFLHIKVNSIKNYFKLLNESYEFATKIYSESFFLDENAQSIIKDCAIQTAKKYFA